MFFSHVTFHRCANNTLTCLFATRMRCNTANSVNFNRCAMLNVMEFSKNFKFSIICTTFFVLLTVTYSSEVSRPRGVSLSRASLYNPDRNFLCFDNNKSIPFSQVNDDYCDCSDGSDEPGTSACPNGIFHCTNAGHKPLNLASSRVNDGICDCCDGSDEYAGNTITCPNICLQLGRYAREEAQKLAEIIKAGKQLKAELSQKGKLTVIK